MFLLCVQHQNPLYIVYKYCNSSTIDDWHGYFKFNKWKILYHTSMDLSTECTLYMIESKYTNISLWEKIVPTIKIKGWIGPPWLLSFSKCCCITSTDSPNTMKLSCESLMEYLIRLFFPCSSLVTFFEVGANRACSKYINTQFLTSINKFL